MVQLEKYVKWYLIQIRKEQQFHQSEIPTCVHKKTKNKNWFMYYLNYKIC